MAYGQGPGYAVTSTTPGYPLAKDTQELIIHMCLDCPLVVLDKDKLDIYCIEHQQLLSTVGNINITKGIEAK